MSRQRAISLASSSGVRCVSAGDDAKAAGVGHGGGHFGKADIMHAALDDRMLDAEHFGDACLHVDVPKAGCFDALVNAVDACGNRTKCGGTARGAGEGNRTLVFSLGSCCSTIELHPRRRHASDGASAISGGSGQRCWQMNII